MNTNYESTLKTACEATFHTSRIAADGGLGSVLELLAACGVGAEVVFDGDAETCPHCVSQLLSEAA